MNESNVFLFHLYLLEINMLKKLYMLFKVIPQVLVYRTLWCSAAVNKYCVFRENNIFREGKSQFPDR
jgi:hypothetical protein